MNLKPLTENVSVSAQISADDVKAIADAGYGAIICNRPDGEEPSQPEFSSIEAAAKEVGLEVRHIPIAGGMFTNEAVAEFETALDTLPRPVVAYCRSGTRCATLWALVNRGKLPSDEILNRTGAAGYDMRHVVG